MNFELIKHIILFVLLLLGQALVCNHIHLFDCATPFLYVYFVLMFRINYPRWGILAWAFVMGLGVDVFSNTPGVAAASMTLLGFVQPSLAQLFVPRDSQENLAPSVETFGESKFVWYTVFSVFLYCIVFYTLEAFNLFNWLYWLGCIFGSTLLTVLLILGIEHLTGSFRKN